MVYTFDSSRYMSNEFPFWIKKFCHDAQTKIIPHKHDFVELVYVLNGNAIHEFESTCYRINPGDVFIINPDETHMYHIEDGNRLEILNCLFMPNLIHETLLRELQLLGAMDFFYVLPFLNSNERFNHRLRLSRKESDAILPLLEGMVNELSQKRPGYQSLIKMKLIEFLVLLSRFHKDQQNEEVDNIMNDQMRSRRICGYLERHFNQKINIPSLAELFHVSSRQLNRIVKKETNSSVLEFVHRIRIERAKQLLRETDESIMSIALLVGYENTAFFSRLFVRLTGITPGEYRSELRDQKGGVEHEHHLYTHT